MKTELNTNSGGCHIRFAANLQRVALVVLSTFSYDTEEIIRGVDSAGERQEQRHVEPIACATFTAQEE